MTRFRLLYAATRLASAPVRAAAWAGGLSIVGLLVPGLSLADGFPTEPLPGADRFSAGRPTSPLTRARPSVMARAKLDPLAVDAGVAVKDEASKSIDLPGVLRLDGADRDTLDPTRVRRISWTNAGSQTVYVSATQPNRIQLPFANPRIVSSTDVEIDKRPSSNNVYVTFAAGVTHPVQIWLEPVSESSASIGLQLVPKAIPAQAIVVLDDTVASTAGRSARSTPENEYLTRVQSLLEQAALGASPEGYAAVELELPPISVNGLAVAGLRRLSGRSEDIYVYTVSNPGSADVQVHEREFDGADVTAVSIVPKPLLHPGARAIVAILAKKREASTAGASTSSSAGPSAATPPVLPSATIDTNERGR